LLGALATHASCESLADDACLALVSRARDGRHYTVDAILPICEDELKHSQCEFIAQSLSLAMSHPGFNGTDFCAQMDAAAFCSDTMDALLTSQPVEDLAYGQCLRAHKKDDTYCRRFQTMFREAVESKDLNTLRACFKIEVEHNPTKSVSAEAQQPVARIIASGSQDLTGMGKGIAESAPPSAARNETVEPAPPERPAEEAGRNQSTSVAEPTAGKENIIVEPIPASGAAADVKEAAGPRTRGSIIVDPVPLPKKQAIKPNGTIIVEPVPLANASAGADGWDSASIFGEKDVSPPPQVRPAAPGRSGVIVEPAPLAMNTGEDKAKAEETPIVVAPVPATMYVMPAQMQASVNSTAGFAAHAPGSNATELGNAVQSPVTSIVTAAAAATLAAQAPVSNAAMVVPAATASPVSNAANLASQAPSSSRSIVAAAAASTNATLSVQAPVRDTDSVAPAANHAHVTNATYLAGQSPVSGTVAAATAAPATPLAGQAPVSNTAVAAAPSEPVVVVPVAVAAPLSNTAGVVPTTVTNTAVIVPATAAASNIAATSKLPMSSPAGHEIQAVSNAAPEVAKGPGIAGVPSQAATASPESNSAGTAVQQPASHIRPVLPSAAVAAASSTARSAVQPPVSSGAPVAKQPVVGSKSPLSSDAVVVAASKAPVGSTVGFASHAPVRTSPLGAPNAPVPTAAAPVAQVPTNNAARLKAAGNATSGSNTAVRVAAVAPASNVAATATVVSATVHAASANPVVAAGTGTAATTNGGTLIIPLLRATIPRNAQQTEAHGAGLAEARAKVARKSASAKHDMEKAEYNGFLAKFVQ